MPLNVILYDPLVLLKAYHTINKALELLNQIFIVVIKVIEQSLKIALINYHEENKIVMTTFHLGIILMKTL